MSDDGQVVSQVLAGQTEAFEVIILKYQQPLFNYIGRMIADRENALDLTQEVFLRAFSGLKTYDPQYNFRSWLFRIASNLVIDQFRKKKLPLTSLDQGREDDEGCLNSLSPADTRALSVTTHYEIKELIRRVEEALEKISPKLREFFLWRYVNGLSYREIAEVSGLPVGTVKNRVFQAKEKIRACLEVKP